MKLVKVGKIGMSIEKKGEESRLYQVELGRLKDKKRDW